MYSLPVTGMGAIVIGGVAVKYPIAAAALAGAMVVTGLVLFLTNRHRKNVAGR
jgi:hypothetical protein